VAIVRTAGTPAAFVLNSCPSRAPEIEGAQEALAALGLPVSPWTIGERRAFFRAVITGRAVTEFAPDSLAAEEVEHLWDWIEEQINDD